MQDRPTALELLGAVARFLDEEIVPVTEGRRQFLSRVAANVLRLVERELVCAEEHAQREWRGLDAILAVEPPPPRSDALRAALRERNASFVEHIRSGAL